MGDQPQQTSGTRLPPQSVQVFGRKVSCMQRTMQSHASWHHVRLAYILCNLQPNVKNSLADVGYQQQGLFNVSVNTGTNVKYSNFTVFHCFCISRITESTALCHEIPRSTKPNLINLQKSKTQVLLEPCLACKAHQAFYSLTAGQKQSYSTNKGAILAALKLRLLLIQRELTFGL